MLGIIIVMPILHLYPRTAVNTCQSQETNPDSLNSYNSTCRAVCLEGHIYSDKQNRHNSDLPGVIFSLVKREIYQVNQQMHI